MESTWNPHGIYLSTWNPHGIYLSTWNPHRNRMEFMWKIPHGFQVEIPYGMVESTWNPQGIHMEYRWKEITKMGEISAKTYSMWNGQIPCGITWIPCGIRGQGKDLQTRYQSCQFFG
jgi:hypothetical protein